MRALPPGLFDSNRLGFQIKDAERERLVGKFQDLIKEIAANAE